MAAIEATSTDEPGPVPVAAVPMVGVVVLNYDGGDLTLRCLRTLRASHWPVERMRIVLVDNASVDGIDWVVRRQFPDVELLSSNENLGFAGGCNLGIRHLQTTGEPVDHIALVNNDAWVEPGWLAPLVEALDADPRVGAASAKMLFAAPARWVRVRTSVGPRPDETDQRDVGVRVSAVWLDKEDAWDHVEPDEGWFGIEAGVRGERGAMWSKAEGELRFPQRPDAKPGRVVSLFLSSPTAKEVELATQVEQTTVTVEPAGTWVDLELGDEPVDIVNNVGSCLFTGGYGGDRGYLERDTGQYESGAEVFAWCGGAVLLRGAYLAQVGVFDERFFLYYEDTDLSWRGRQLGWRYRYVPTSVVRHEHAASSGEGSYVFRFHVDRNRLLMLAKNAPARLALAAYGRYAVDVVAMARREYVDPLRERRRPHGRLAPQRAKSLRSAIRLAPAMVRERKQLRKQRSVGDADLMRWMVSK